MVINATIIEEANKCVLCGLCLPECPTFNETRLEAQSPRGRIALAKALAENLLPANKSLQANLDSCLQCRACEKACPSKVNYKKLIRSTQVLIKQINKQKPKKQLTELLVVLSKDPALYDSLTSIYKKSGARWLSQKSGLLKLLNLAHIDALLPEHKELQAITNPVNNNKNVTSKKIGLFTGCVSQSLDRQTINSAQVIFNVLGVEPVLANQQLCCGGLKKSISGIETAFPENINTIVSFISGCTAELQENNTGYKKISDISEFLNEQDFEKISFKPYSGTIAVHEPCSLRYPLGAQNAAYELLAKIPEANVIPLPENNRCCGGAGDYLFRQPVMAEKLRLNKMDMINTLPALPDIIVTSNLGCALTLQAGLRKQNSKIEVIHPVTMLARQI